MTSIIMPTMMATTTISWMTSLLSLGDIFRMILAIKSCKFKELEVG